jgi:hypothetical protein
LRRHDGDAHEEQHEKGNGETTRGHGLHGIITSARR